MDNLVNLITSGIIEFRKLDKQKKIIILFILIASFVIGIGIPVGFSNTKSVPKQASVTPIPTEKPIPASLSLTLDKQTVEAGSTFSATLNIDSPNQGVEAADYAVKFDPNYLKVATSSNGNYFRIFQPQKLTEGAIGYSAMAEFVNEKFVIPKGKGILMKVTFKALGATDSTEISVDRENTVIATGGKNILDKITNASISIK